MTITDPILQALAAEFNAALEHCPQHTARLIGSSVQGRLEYLQTRLNEIPQAPAATQEGPG